MCSTNGCPTYLTVDPRTGVANCDICGYTRRPHWPDRRATRDRV